METITYRNIINKTTWPDGPWKNEPDKVQWPDTETGLPCLAVRQARVGHWCGYVGVPDGHPAFGKGYDEVDVEVHGGPTFSEFCNPSGNEASGVCHIPGEGEPDHVWWIGFDCAHGYDMSPALSGKFDYGGAYRTLEYVQDQCKSLARQLRQMERERGATA